MWYPSRNPDPEPSSIDQRASLSLLSAAISRHVTSEFEGLSDQCDEVANERPDVNQSPDEFFDKYAVKEEVREWIGKHPYHSARSDDADATWAAD